MTAPRTHRERTEQDIDNTGTYEGTRTENAPRTHRERTEDLYNEQALRIEEVRSKKEKDIYLPDFSKNEDEPQWEPTDSQFELIANYNAAEEVSQWESIIGAIPAPQRLMAQNALIRLHQYFRLSIRQLRAIIAEIASNAESREWWGSSPTGLLKLRSDGTFSWQKVAKRIRDKQSATKNPKHNGHPRDEIRPLPRSAASLIADVPPDIDPDCTCGAGWLRDQGRSLPCPDCTRGQYHRAKYDGGPQ